MRLNFVSDDIEKLSSEYSWVIIISNFFFAVRQLLHRKLRNGMAKILALSSFANKSIFSELKH